MTWRMGRSMPILLALLLNIAAIAAAVASEAGGSYTGTYRYLSCQASVIVQPSSTQELASTVRLYVAQAEAGTPVLIRASRPKFHSSASFPCPIVAGSPAPSALAGTGGQQPVTVGVLHSKLDKVLAVDRTSYTMRVGAGMDINKLLAAATAAKMSVQLGSLPVYAGLTLAGILSTSAHGSGDKTVHNLEDTLVDVTFVDGKGNIVTLQRDHPDFKAVASGLGLMGVITEMTIQLTPPSNTELITWYNRPDHNLAELIPEMLKVSPHVLVFWRPDLSRFSAFITKEAPEGSEANPAVQMSLLPNVQDQYSTPIPGAYLKTIQARQGDDPLTTGLVCPITSPSSITSFSWATIAKRPAYNVTAPTNNMMASECDEHCLWNDNKILRATAQDVEMTMEYSQLTSWISDVRKILDEDLYLNGRARYRCMGPGYMWIRFGKGSDTFLATNHGMERPVYVQATWIRSRDVPQYQIRYQFVLDIFEQLTLCKYNARPHWGKNFDRTFTHPRCPIRPKYAKFDEFLATQAKYDPHKVYESPLFKKVVAQESYTLSPRCSLTGSCFCEDDSHCPINHSCVPAISFPEYKVCKFNALIMPKPFPILFGK